MLEFIDVHVQIDQVEPVIPARACMGAVLYGNGAKGQREFLERSDANGLWRHAESLERIVGETHARYPSRYATVIDLQNYLLMPGLM